MAEPSTGHAIIDEDLRATLAGFDTPTICNALEIAAPERPRSTGYTRETFVVAQWLSSVLTTEVTWRLALESI